MVGPAPVAGLVPAPVGPGPAADGPRTRASRSGAVTLGRRLATNSAAPTIARISGQPTIVDSGKSTPTSLPTSMTKTTRPIAPIYVGPRTANRAPQVTASSEATSSSRSQSRLGDATGGANRVLDWAKAVNVSDPASTADSAAPVIMSWARSHRSGSGASTPPGRSRA